MDLKILHKNLLKEFQMVQPKGRYHVVTIETRVNNSGTEITISGECYQPKERGNVPPIIFKEPNKTYTLNEAIHAFRKVISETDNKIELND